MVKKERQDGGDASVVDSELRLDVGPELETQDTSVTHPT